MNEVSNGTTCNVEIHENIVRKTPLAVTAKDLHQRGQLAEGLMRGIYYGEKDLPILRTELSADGSHIEQEFIKGRPLAHLSDEEIAGMNDEAKETLIDLLMCNEKMRVEFGDFIDLFGYDDVLGWLMKVFRTLNVRYSTNIFLTDEGEIKLIDADLYYRKERLFLRQILADVMTPVMFFYIRKFRKQLQNSLEGGRVLSMVETLKALVGGVLKRAIPPPNSASA